MPLTTLLVLMVGIPFIKMVMNGGWLIIAVPRLHNICVTAGETQQSGRWFGRCFYFSNGISSSQLTNLNFQLETTNKQQFFHHDISQTSLVKGRSSAISPASRESESRSFVTCSRPLRRRLVMFGFKNQALLCMS